MIGDRPFELRRVEPGTISDADVAAFASLANALRHERDPDDPPRSETSFRSNFEGMAAFAGARIDWWFAEIGGEVVGHTFSYILPGNENRHLLQTTVQVAAPHRRHGVGSALLHRAAAFASQNDRTLLQSDSSDRVPGGDAFAERLGARLGIRNRSSQLMLADVDRELVGRWIAQGEELRDRFELGFWLGPFPDDDLAAIADLQHVMNTAPTDDLDIEDERTTPERLREMETYHASRGTERWTAYLRERATGLLVGYTEVYWEQHNPEALGQGDTAVRIPFRGLGLGKWLKAAMLRRVLSDRPVAKRIRTSNAGSNDAMLGINHALGFRPYETTSVWQAEVGRVLERLGGAAP